jgi:hypothetical protein
MKKYCFLIIFFLVGSIAFSQSTEEMPKDNRDKLNEIKFNAGAVIFEIVELSYERIVSDHVGVGCSFAYNATEFPSFGGYVLPYFRFYPSEKRKGSGFFLEANSGAIFSEQETWVYSPMPGLTVAEDENPVGFGFGIGVGGKWVTDSGLFGEVYGGFGREFNEDSFIEAYPRLGLNFGYRF